GVLPPACTAGHLPGAVHLPTAEIAARAGELVPPDATVVTYCWGPGCDGATRAALEFARLGRPVKEMRQSTTSNPTPADGRGATPPAGAMGSPTSSDAASRNRTYSSSPENSCRAG
ncbi:rhodanese-like domain-containing protein, partial [Micromonospora aurantiaca]|uniref:rhodanese-like domain-containing protein n=1 Tax=Micromonospora aurantiaca (nom. illeg.) TaxID=47850 RepID=UPI003657C21C